LPNFIKNYSKPTETSHHFCKKQRNMLFLRTHAAKAAITRAAVKQLPWPKKEKPQNPPITTAMPPLPKEPKRH